MLANIISNAKKTLKYLKKAIALKVIKSKANSKDIIKVYNKLENKPKDHAKDNKPKAMSNDNNNNKRKAKEEPLKLS